MQLNTVNVIEFTNGNLQSLRAFPETPEGNKAAEDLFVKCINEDNTNRHSFGGECRSSNFDGSAFLDNGYWNSGEGYEIYLTHST